MHDIKWKFYEIRKRKQEQEQTKHLNELSQKLINRKSNIKVTKYRCVRATEKRKYNFETILITLVPQNSFKRQFQSRRFPISRHSCLHLYFITNVITSVKQNCDCMRIFGARSAGRRIQGVLYAKYVPICLCEPGWGENSV